MHRRSWLAAVSPSPLLLSGCLGSGDGQESTPNTGEQSTPATGQESPPSTDTATAQPTPHEPVQASQRYGESVCSFLDSWRNRAIEDLSGTDLGRIVARHRREVLTSAPGEQKIGNWLETLQSNGAFSDIDYDHESRVSPWDPADALERIRGLCQAYLRSEHPRSGDDRLKEAAVSALGYWVRQGITNSNWWWNEIGIPRIMRDVLVLMTGEDRQWLVEDGETRDMAFQYLSKANTRRTGANLIDLAVIELLYAALTADTELVVDVTGTAVREITITREEGIQPDYSFKQHQSRLKQYAYGTVFLKAAIRFAQYVADTGVAVPEDRLALMVDMVLDGMRWMQRGGYFSISTGGRSASKNLDLWGPGYTTIPHDIAELTDHRTGELRAYAAHVANKAPVEPGTQLITGHRTYWESDLAVQHRPGYFVSLKTQSERTLAPEIVNDEGHKMAQHKNGVYWLTQRGDEFSELQPVLDWSRLPGLTARQIVPADGREVSPAFTGGVSDGTYGTSAFEFPTERSLSYRKAWFFGEGTISCLGAGITAEGGEDPLLTSLDQRRHAGDVRYGSTAGQGGQTLSTGTSETVTAEWIEHDGIGYVFPEPTEAVVQTREESGSWHELNRKLDDETVTETVFSAWLDHGSAPNGQSYAYHVTPGTSPAEEGAAVDARVLANGTDHQAVHYPAIDVTGAVFWEAGSIDWDGGSLVVDQPCIVQVSSPSETRTLTAVDPTTEHDTLSITVDGTSHDVDVAECTSGRLAGTQVQL